MALGTIYITLIDILNDIHSVKSVRIRSFSGPHFTASGLNTPYLSVFSPNGGKYEPEKTRNTDNFYGVMTDANILDFGDYTDFVGESLKSVTAQKMKFFIKDFFSRCDKISRKTEWETLFFVQCVILGL